MLGGEEKGHLAMLGTGLTYIILLWEVADGRQWSDRHPLLLCFGHHQQDATFLRPTEEERINQERQKEEQKKGLFSSETLKY